MKFIRLIKILIENQFWYLIVFILFTAIYSATLKAQNPSWHIILPENLHYNFTSIDFVNENTGWFAGNCGDSNPPNAIKSLVLKTIDGGNSWIVQKFDSLKNSPVWVSDIKFLNENTGLLITYQGLYSTFNGGSDWTKCFNQSDSMFFNTACPLNDSLWFVGGGVGSVDSSILGKDEDYYIEILKTTNCGNTWQVAFKDTLHYPIKIIEAINDSTLIAISGPTILLSENYGNTWNVINDLPGISFVRIQSIESKLFAFVADIEASVAALFVSYDLGYNWTERFRFNDHPGIFCMQFADTLLGRAAGLNDGRGILKTINGGYSWTFEESPIEWSIWDIYSFQNTAFAATSEGIILKYGIQTAIRNQDNNFKVANVLDLYPNFPNPFNPKTTLHFKLSQSEDVKISIFNVQGQLIQSFNFNNLKPGDNFFTFAGKLLSSGTYLYIITTGKISKMGKISFIK